MKKFFEIVLSVVTVIALMAMVSGCGSSETVPVQDGQNVAKVTQQSVQRPPLADEELKEAQTAFENHVKCVQTMDTENEEKYIDYGIVAEVEADAMENIDVVSRAVFSSVQYEVLSCKGNDEGIVTVEAKFTTIDLTGVLGKCTVDVLMETEENDYTDEELEARTMERFIEELGKEGLPTVENTINVNVKKTDNGWKVESSPEYRNVVSGGIIGALADAKASMLS